MRSTSETEDSDPDEGRLTDPATTKEGLGISRHDAAMTQAGESTLLRALQPFGVMRKSTLKREAGAEHWHDYEFESALNAAVRTGAIRRLPFGFYAKTNDTDRALHEHNAKTGR